MNNLGVNRESITALAAEAESKPVDFNATERSAFVRKTIQQVKSMKASGYSKDDIKAGFPDFAEQYPGLFEMVMKPGYDEKSLSLMINLLDKMGSGQTSQHQASIKVGQHLMNEYVNPVLPPTSGATVPTSTNQ
jgi:hypothetical protein